MQKTDLLYLWAYNHWANERVLPLWQLLLHMVNHSMQFRSEASILLTAYHQSPGDLDMLIFQREQQ